MREPVSSPRRRRPIATMLAALALLATVAPVAASAQEAAADTRFDGRTHPEWVKDAAIYELNLRHFTPEGTLAAAQAHLPRLKALGIGIVWLMPIHPVGKVRPAGPLGSPYAVRDFRGVDPAYGGMDDLKRFVATAHGLGLKVILDWVGNHSAWDNPLTTEHPDWYERTADGKLRSPSWFTWNDVVEFDYAAPGLQRYMADAMAFWVREGGVDGFRADAAGLMPLEFWNRTRAELDAIKPVFMLGEWESRDLHYAAFDATYAWSWTRALEAFAAGRGSMDELRAYYAWDGRFWPKNAPRMLYISNHDANSWQGTEYERYGPALDAAIALSIASEGMPLVFNGQEAGNRRRLKLFERDPIVWREDPQGELYRRLLTLRKRHPVMWARPWGGPIEEVVNDDQAHVLSFLRQRGDDRMLAIFNLSAEPRVARLTVAGQTGAWRDQGSSETIDMNKPARVAMPPWSWKLFFAKDAPAR